MVKYYSGKLKPLSREKIKNMDGRRLSVFARNKTYNSPMGVVKIDPMTQLRARVELQRRAKSRK